MADPLKLKGAVTNPKTSPFGPAGAPKADDAKSLEGVPTLDEATTSASIDYGSGRSPSREKIAGLVRELAEIKSAASVGGATEETELDAVRAELSAAIGAIGLELPALAEQMPELAGEIEYLGRDLDFVAESLDKGGQLGVAQARTLATAARLPDPETSTGLIDSVRASAKWASDEVEQQIADMAPGESLELAVGVGVGDWAAGRKLLLERSKDGKTWTLSDTNSLGKKTGLVEKGGSLTLVKTADSPEKAVGMLKDLVIRDLAIGAGNVFGLGVFTAAAAEFFTESEVEKVGVSGSLKGEEASKGVADALKSKQTPGPAQGKAEGTLSMGAEFDLKRKTAAFVSKVEVGVTGSLGIEQVGMDVLATKVEAEFRAATDGLSGGVKMTFAFAHGEIEVSAQTSADLTPAARAAIENYDGPLEGLVALLEKSSAKVDLTVEARSVRSIKIGTGEIETKTSAGKEPVSISGSLVARRPFSQTTTSVNLAEALKGAAEWFQPEVGTRPAGSLTPAPRPDRPQ